MSKILLNLCPFCGGEPTGVAETPMGVRDTTFEEHVTECVYHIQCPDCHAAGSPMYDKLDAIDHWNRRFTGEVPVS